MDSLHSAVRITYTTLTAIIATWLMGFLVFFILVVTDRPELPDKPIDVVVVLTGGPGRIETGFDLLAKDKAKALLITGVHPNVTLRDLIALWPSEPQNKTKLLQHCCVFLEYEASSTEENASETKSWLERNGGAENVILRLVTSNYHLPRALLLYRHALPQAIIYRWPVASDSMSSLMFWRNTIIEYHKTILTWIAGQNA